MKNKRVKFTSWMICILLVSSVTLCGQEDQENVSSSEPAETRISFNALYTSNDTVVLTATVFRQKERDVIWLQNARISFSAGDGKSNGIALGKVSSDSMGNAVLTVPLNFPLPSNEEGMIQYTASFDGNQNYLPVAESFQSKPARLEVSFYEEDSVKYIRVTGTQFSRKEDIEPLSGETVNLFVPSLFRPLPIGEISLGEDGTGNMEFPMSLIGDSSGNITVIARIDEHDKFGFVKGQAQIGWAIPKHLLAQDKPSRELWTPVAPIWMIITLLIMLAGVWAHYIYAIIQLIKIKTSSKKETLPEKDWSNYS